MTSLMRPQDLRTISEHAEWAKMKEKMTYAKKQEKEREALREAFMHTEVGAEAYERVNTAVCRAAEQGANQVMIFSFPASYCNDGGRRINNSEPDWPDSLEGFAKKAYRFYEKELKPLGYRARAEIIDFPDGFPGNVGMFLKW